MDTFALNLLRAIGLTYALVLPIGVPLILLLATRLVTDPDLTVPRCVCGYDLRGLSLPCACPECGRVGVLWRSWFRLRPRPRAGRVLGLYVLLLIGFAASFGAGMAYAARLSALYGPLPAGVQGQVIDGSAVIVTDFVITSLVLSWFLARLSRRDARRAIRASVIVAAMAAFVMVLTAWFLGSLAPRLNNGLLASLCAAPSVMLMARRKIRRRRTRRAAMG